MRRLLFDDALNNYEVQGAGREVDDFAHLQRIGALLKDLDIVISGLYLEGREIRIAHGSAVFTVGHLYVQEAPAFVYPCFRDEFVFDFERDIASFALWQAMDGELSASYGALKSQLVTAGVSRVNLALTRDFVAMSRPSGELFRAGKAEQDFLNGLMALYQLGVAQARVRRYRGVTLPSLADGAANRRRKRAIEHSLNLLVGDDVAVAKLYQVISQRHAESRTGMDMLSTYYGHWKGNIKTEQHMSTFLSSINLWSLPADLLVGLRQLNTLRTYGPLRVQLSLPVVGSVAWKEMLVNIDKEFGVIRGTELVRLFGPYSHHYLDLGADYTISNSGLSIKYSIPAVEGVSFDGVVNVIGHGRNIDQHMRSQPESVAQWLHDNILDVHGVAGFRKLKFVNFQACRIHQVLASYIVCLLLKKSRRHFELNRIPVVLAISSPWAPVVLNANRVFGSLSATWQEHTLALPGLVLKGLDHVIRTIQVQGVPLQLAVQSGLTGLRGFQDLSNLPYRDYLRLSQVLALDHSFLSGEHYLSSATLELLASGLQTAVQVRNAGLAECARLIRSRFASNFAAIEQIVTTASIVPRSWRANPSAQPFQARLLKAGAVETVKQVVDFLLMLKSATDRGDWLEGLRLYNDTKIKFLIDPYDHRGAERKKFIVDTLFSLTSTSVQRSAQMYNDAFEKFFLLSKQEYQEMTGIDVDRAISYFFLRGTPDTTISPQVFRDLQATAPEPTMLVVDSSVYGSLLGSEQLGVSSRDLRAAFEAGDESPRLLAAMEQLQQNLKNRRPALGDALSLKHLQDTEENLQRAKTALEKNRLPGPLLKTSARMASGASRLLGAFGVLLDFRTQPFHLDFSSLRSGVFTASDSLAVTKGLFDFTSDVGVALRLRLASSAFRAIWQSRLDQLFFRLNKVLLPLDVLFTAVSLYRNIEGVRLAKSAEEQALYLSMSVIDGVAFGVTLAGFALIAVPGVGVALILVGVALAVVNILLNAIVGLTYLEDYRWDEKVGLYFDNLFGSSSLFAGSLSGPPTALEGITAQQQMRSAADQLFDELRTQGIDLLLTPVFNDSDDEDQTNPLKAIGPQGPNRAQGYTLSPLGMTADELKGWPDAKGQDKSRQVRKGWYLRRTGQARKLMVTLPATPGRQGQVLDFGPLPAVLLFGATPHLLLSMSPFGWAPGESPQEQARQAYQVKLYPATAYTLQFKKSLLGAKDHDSHFDSYTRLLVPEGDYPSLPQVALDLSAQGDGRETLRELDLADASLAVIKFKDRSQFRLDLVRAGDGTPCALEQVVRTVQLPAHINFRTGRTHPVMAVVGDGSRVTLRNTSGQSLLLLRAEVKRCDIEIDAAVGGFAISI